MKKIFLILILIIFVSVPAFAQYKPNLKKLTHISNNIKIQNRKFICDDYNCYDFGSFRYNRLTKTYSFDMLMDLMWCNYHQEYKSPYNDGYITHLVFKVNFHEPDKINIKCTGYVTGNVVVEYENGKASSAHYEIISEHKNKPSVIKDMKSLEDNFYVFIDVNSISKILKTW